MKQIILFFIFILTQFITAQEKGNYKNMVETVEKTLSENVDDFVALYKHLHQNPELSLHEKETSKKIIDELKSAGLEVHSELWGYGFLGLLKNGEGPTIMVRTDLDALPLIEKTDLEYASSKKVIKNNKEVGVMHACGHDMHMTVFTGTAKTLAAVKETWNGTILFLGQPAEEIGQGAKNLIEAGLFEKFPVPDYILAYHIAPSLAANQIGYVEGYAFANVDMIDLIVYGEGGHGASPHKTKDPIVLSSQIVLALQTIVSRELSPLEPAVITVGSIHGGTTHNIIPAEVKLEITCRSYSMEVRDKILEAIQRTADGLAASYGLAKEKYPKMVVRDSFAPAVFNDPELTQKAAEGIKKFIGEENTIQVKPEMIAEDFAYFGLTENKIPISMFRLGINSQEKIEQYKKENKKLPALHSPYLAPLPKATIETGVKGMTGAILKLLSK